MNAATFVGYLLLDQGAGNALSADPSPDIIGLSLLRGKADMGKFRKKPVVIEARQWNGRLRNGVEIVEWVKSGGFHSDHMLDDEDVCFLSIDTLVGRMRADPGDWIIRGVKGEFYPCKPDIFEATYESFSNRLAAAVYKVLRNPKSSKAARTAAGRALTVRLKISNSAQKGQG